MKKFYITFIALLLLFSAGNVFGQGNTPTCGVWQASDGSYTQSFDTNWNPGGTAAQAYCTAMTGTPLWQWNIPANSCTQVQAGTMYGVVQYPYPAAWTVYGPYSTLYLKQEQQTKTVGTPAAPIGTMKFTDYRQLGAMVNYTANIYEQQSQSITLWAPPNYSPSQSAESGCNYTHGSQPTTNFPDIITSKVKMKGVVQSTTDYTEVEAWYDQSLLVVSGSNPVIFQGMVRNMRIEVTKPLQSDANKSGSVTLADYIILAAEFNATQQCGCGAYWY